MAATKIRKTPGICNGAACIGRTQIPVWKLIALYSDGCSEANLLSDYPNLTKDDLKAARTYYAQNPVEIDEVMVTERLRSPYSPSGILRQALPQASMVVEHTAFGIAAQNSDI